MTDKNTAYLSRALDYYKRVLHKESGNIYAANGVAMVLAQSGRLVESKRIFAQLREAASGQLGHVWTNLAHIHLHLKEYGPATKLYQSALDRFHNGQNVPLMLCIAKSLWSAAVTIDKKEGNAIKVKDRRLLKQCKRTLQKALHLSPRDYSIQFNLALVLKTGAEDMMRSVKDVHQAYLEAGEDVVATAPPFTKSDLEVVDNDNMIMRRLAGFLATIKDEREFPKGKRAEAEEFMTWGKDASDILPEYINAVDEMRERYESPCTLDPKPCSHPEHETPNQVRELPFGDKPEP
jgi:tetratricopeptide (TPR) repeat protein